MFLPEMSNGPGQVAETTLKKKERLSTPVKFVAQWRSNHD